MTNGSWRPPSSSQPSASHGASPLFQESVSHNSLKKKTNPVWTAKLVLTLHHLVVLLGIFSVWRSLCSFFSSGSLGREMWALRWHGRTVFHIHNVLIAIQWTMWGLHAGRGNATRWSIQMPFSLVWQVSCQWNQLWRYCYLYKILLSP